MRQVKYLVCFLLIALLAFTSSCQRDKHIETSISEINKYGHAVLKISQTEFKKQGVSLGDIVQVEVNDNTYTMPYFSGYYVDEGEYVLYASNTSEEISICINFGNFSSVANAKAGDEVEITVLEKEGALAIQQVNQLVHSNRREDFNSDEEFSNFRMVALGNIKENILYRSASPINNKHNRASITNKLVKNANIQTIANLADNKEIIYEAAMESAFDSTYYVDLYENNKVKFFPLTLNFRTDSFGQLATEAIIYISQNEGPYLVHCTEGDYRTDFIIMLIALVMGATVEEICEDYMLTYENYYHITKDSNSDKYNNILEAYCMESLRHIAGVGKGADISNINLQEKAIAFLMKYGMTDSELETLQNKLKS